MRRERSEQYETKSVSSAKSEYSESTRLRKGKKKGEEEARHEEEVKKSSVEGGDDSSPEKKGKTVIMYVLRCKRRV